MTDDELERLALRLIDDIVLFADVVSDSRMPPRMFRLGDRWFLNNDGAQGVTEIDRPGWWEST